MPVETSTTIALGAFTASGQSGGLTAACAPGAPANANASAASQAALVRIDRLT
jgi:hypothetical protein